MACQSFLEKKFSGADSGDKCLKFRIIGHLLCFLHAIDIKWVGQSSGCDVANNMSDGFLSTLLLSVSFILNLLFSLMASVALFQLV